MILFRYLESAALETLESGHLRVSQVTSYNDPFECMFQVTGEMTPEKGESLLRHRVKSPDFCRRVRQRNPHLLTDDDVRRDFEENRASKIEGICRAYEAFKRVVASPAPEELMDEYLRTVCFSAAENAGDEVLQIGRASCRERV